MKRTKRRRQPKFDVDKILATARRNVRHLIKREQRSEVITADVLLFRVD